MKSSKLRELEEIWPECVGCGYCCKKVRCAVSFIAEEHLNINDLYKVEGKVPETEPECPYLYWDTDRYKCFLAQNEYFREMLAINTGCTSTLNSERRKYGKSQAKTTKKP